MAFQGRVELTVGYSWTAGGRGWRQSARDHVACPPHLASRSTGASPPPLVALTPHTTCLHSPSASDFSSDEEQITVDGARTATQNRKTLQTSHHMILWQGSCTADADLQLSTGLATH